MSNDLTTTDSGASNAVTAFVGGNPFLQTQKDLGGGGVFGRFNGKTGNYILGDDVIDGDYQAAFEFMDAKLSWLGFDPDNNPVRGPEAFIAKGEQLADPDKSNPMVRWNKQLVVPIVTMEGTRVIYSSKADYGSRPIIKLMGEFGQQLMRNRDTLGRPKIPVVDMSAVEKSRMIEETGSDGIKRKQKTTFFAEVFRISGWMTIDELNDLLDGVGPEDGMVEVNHAEEATYEILEPEKSEQRPAQSQSVPAQKASPARPTSRFQRNS